MIQADDLTQNKVSIEGKWYIAKPCPRPFWWRIKDAVQVIKGRAEAVIFYKQ